MVTNSSMTIYSRTFNFEKDMDVYYRIIVDKVFWSSQDGQLMRATGVVSDDKVKIMIPFDSKFSESDFMIKSGDIVVRGYGPEIKSPRDLESYFTITAANYKDVGSKRMHHWELSAK